MPSKPVSTPSPSSSLPRSSPTSSNSSTSTTKATIPPPRKPDPWWTIIYGEWLKRRLRAAETQIWAYDHQENYRPDPKYPLGQTAANRGKAFAQLQWRIECTRRATRQALQDLQQLQAAPPTSPAPAAPEPVTNSPQITSPQIGFVLPFPAAAPPQPEPDLPQPHLHVEPLVTDMDTGPRGGVE